MTILDRCNRLTVFMGLLIFAFSVLTAHAQVSVVDMTPSYFSDEANNDSEPNIAVNPNDPTMIAATAFTIYPPCGNKAPIYFSTDGGNTWQLRCLLPGSAPNTCPGTCDVTLRFAAPRQHAEGNSLYIGMLSADENFTLTLSILRSSDMLSATPIASRSAAYPNIPDQPYIQVATARAANIPSDRIFMGLNDLEVGVPPATATVEGSQDGGAQSPVFTPSRIDAVQPCGQDALSVRPAIHSSGTVYAGFLRWTQCNALPIIGDVMMVRDDNWASGNSGNKPFTSLKDPVGAVGVKVASNVSFPFNSKLGNTQRIGSQLSVAVSPVDSKIVYVAWAGGISPLTYTIHIVKSGDRGVSWNELFTEPQATNPAIAVDQKGEVGLLFQRLAVADDRWETHLSLSKDDFQHSKKDIKLATVPNDHTLVNGGAGPLGDYDDLTAVGTTFFGIFSAFNFPDKGNFPDVTVMYLRNHNFTPPTLLGNDGATRINPSIDPFFVKVDTASLNF